jgi:tetratricopeptide (TPR) repeat protein
MDPAFLPALAHLGRIYTAEGRYDEALATFERLGAIDSSYFNLDVMLGHLYAKSGRIDESREILADLLSKSDSQEGKAFEIGIVYSSLGEADSALVWFNRAVDNREFSALLMDVNVMTDNLRNDPRYPALKKRIGL